MVGGHEDAGDVRGDELADEDGELLEGLLDCLGGPVLRGRVVARRIDDVVVDVHGGGTLEPRAHCLDVVLCQFRVSKGDGVLVCQDCATRINSQRRSAIGLDNDLVFAAYVKGQLLMREQRGHTEGGNRRKHRVPGVHGDCAASKGAQVADELYAGLVSESIGDDDDSTLVGSCYKETMERVDAPTGRRNGEIPCAHAAQGIIPRA